MPGERAGLVSLIGAGPGDPGLLTLRGKAALERADVVLYDRLVNLVLLRANGPVGQERIPVGKTAGGGLDAQERINALLVERALGGARVARLKGGDPFVLGRGAEECLACVAAGVPFEVIPGVSSVHAVPAYAGIPLTYREAASGFTVLTGHERWDAGARVDWQQVAGQGGTIVVLMGVLQAERWTRGLLEGGRDPETPVAIVRCGTLPEQELLVSTLGRVAGEIRARQLRPPALAVVGEVVRLAGTLAWYRARPLSRWVVGVPRAGAWGDEISRDLEELGATLLPLPLTQQRPVEGGRRLQEALGGAGFTDLVLTSAHGAEALGAALAARGLDARSLHGREIWAVGPATADSLARVGLRADHLPEGASAAGLVALAERLGVARRRFLHPASAQARPELREGLRALGAEVAEVAAYETVDHPQASALLASALERGLNLVALTSPSAVDALLRAALGAARTLEGVSFAAIGPTTAAHARERGLDVAVVAATSTLAGLQAAILAWGGTRPT